MHVCRHSIIIIRDARYAIEIEKSLQINGYIVHALPSEGHLREYQYCRIRLPPERYLPPKIEVHHEWLGEDVDRVIY
jgi:hypothetical protein